MGNIIYMSDGQIKSKLHQSCTSSQPRIQNVFTYYCLLGEIKGVYNGIEEIDAQVRGYGLYY